MKNKNLKRLLKGSEKNFLISTENGVGIVGDKVEVLTQFTELVRKLREAISDEELKNAFELSFKTNEELEKIALEKPGNLLKTLKEISGDKDNE